MTVFQPKPSRKRISWIDIARGIGIVLVVFGHVLRGLVGAHMLSTSNPIWACDYTVYTFHMPLFFVLAGLQVDRSLSKGRWPFLKNKIETIAYPYFLWSWFQLGLQMLLPSDMVNGHHSAMTMISIFWRPVEQFWFLFVLFICHGIACLTRARRPLLLLALFGGLVANVLILAGRLSNTTLTGSLAPWVVFYTCGILFSAAFLRWQPTRQTATLWTIASVFALLALSHVCRAFSKEQSDSILSWPVTVAGLFMLISGSHLLDRGFSWFSNGWAALGRASMTIYIFHGLAAAGSRAALHKVHLTAWGPLVIIDTLLGVGVPFVLHRILERLDLLSLLGLGGTRRISSPQPAPMAVSPGLE